VHFLQEKSKQLRVHWRRRRTSALYSVWLIYGQQLHIAGRVVLFHTRSPARDFPNPEIRQGMRDALN